MERKIYPSDITREQFEIVRPFLESAKKKTRPRKHDVYDLFCALLYILKSGCQWSMLPSDFPNYKTVHYYFRIWKYKKNKKTPSILEDVLKKISRQRTYEEWQRLQHDHGYC
jgi:transposase